MPNKRIDQLDPYLNSLTGQELIPIFDKSTNNTERISIDTLVAYIDVSDDTITGGTYNNTTKTLTLEKNGGTEINITGFTDFYTTGATLNGSVLEFDRNNNSNAYSVDLSSLIFTGDTYVTNGTYISGGTLTFDYNNGGNFSITGLTNDLNTTISELAEADETTVTLNTITNKIELKSVVGPGSGGTRTFEGDIVISGGLSTASSVYVPNIETIDNGEGIVMKSPDGTRYKLTIDNGGSISITLA